MSEYDFLDPAGARRACDNRRNYRRAMQGIAQAFDGLAEPEAAFVALSERDQEFVRSFRARVNAEPCELLEASRPDHLTEQLGKTIKIRRILWVVLAMQIAGMGLNVLNRGLSRSRGSAVGE